MEPEEYPDRRDRAITTAENLLRVLYEDRINLTESQYSCLQRIMTLAVDALYGRQLSSLEAAFADKYNGVFRKYRLEDCDEELDVSYVYGLFKAEYLLT